MLCDAFCLSRPRCVARRLLSLVPEPFTRAFMIIGFALIGSGLRPSKLFQRLLISAQRTSDIIALTSITRQDSAHVRGTAFREQLPASDAVAAASLAERRPLPLDKGTELKPLSRAAVESSACGPEMEWSAPPQSCGQLKRPNLPA